METIWKDLGQSVRSLIRRTGFTTVAVFTLAWGICANTVIFSVINAVALQPLPFKDADCLVAVWEANRQEGSAQNVSFPNYYDWMTRNRVFDGIAAFNISLPTLMDDQGAERIPGAVISANFFSVLGFSPAMGRDFLPEEDRPDGERVL